MSFTANFATKWIFKCIQRKEFVGWLIYADIRLKTLEIINKKITRPNLINTFLI